MAGPKRAAEDANRHNHQIRGAYKSYPVIQDRPVYKWDRMVGHCATVVLVLVPVLANIGRATGFAGASITGIRGEKTVYAVA